MKALLTGSGPPSEALQRSDPCNPTTLSSIPPQPLGLHHSPQHAQQAQHAQQQSPQHAQRAQHAQQHSPQHAQQAQQAQHVQQQPSQSQQPIKVSLLPGSNKLLTPTQVKELSWQNHLKLYKVSVLPRCSWLQFFPNPTSTNTLDSTTSYVLAVSV